MTPRKARLRDSFVDELRRRSTAEAPLTVLGFSEGVRLRGDAPAAAPDAALPALEGRRTDIAAALATGIGLAAPPRRSALLLLSDGEENAGSALRLAPELRRAGIPLLAFDLSASDNWSHCGSFTTSSRCKCAKMPDAVAHAIPDADPVGRGCPPG